MTTISEQNRIPPPKGIPVPWSYPDVQLLKINSKELIGIEVEVENTQFVGDIQRPWNVKEDGSLRNGGRELVSDPINASSAPEALYHLLVRGLSSECSFNMRTSIHIHINATDMTDEQIRNLVAIYTIFEPALFNFAGRGRWKSVFCVPLNECNQLAYAALRNIGDGRWEKYTALNLRRLADLGTIEFRHLGGTFDVDHVCQWIDMICSLKAYVMNTPTAAIRAEIAQMHPYTDFNGIAQRVFGEYARLLQVSDSTVYYSASLNARMVFSQKQETFRVAEESPLNQFFVTSKRSN